jgi:outer membrane protein assembly factor BamB
VSRTGDAAKFRIADCMNAPNQIAPQPRPATDRWVRLTAAAAKVAGTFCVLVAALLLINHFGVPSQDPLKSKAIAEAKERLREAPKDEHLKQQIRDLDLQVRHRFFRHLATNNAGAWLLLAGAALFLIAARKTASDRKAPHLPPPFSGDVELARDRSGWGRWAVAATTVAVLALLLGIAAGTRVLVPDRASDLEKLLAGPGASPEGVAGPTLDEVLRNWTRFRGPRGDGVALSTNVPLTWNAATGEGILWRTEVPVKGFNSPVVWANRVFLTGGDEKAREVLCFDADTGSVVWRKAVPTAPPSAGKKVDIPEQTGYAASTGATDGRRFFAVFATGDLAAFDFSGNVVWSKSFGAPENMYGFATSLLIWQGRLILQFDQGEAEAGKSRLYAFEAATGRLLWEQRRSVPSSWATPLVIEAANRQQIITLGQPWVIAYDFTDGRELWRVDCLGSDLAPSPIFAGGLVLAVSAGKQMTAIRPDGQGDVTKTHVAWITEDNIPDITSPAGDGDLVFLATTDGMLTCLETKSGAKRWEQRLDLEFNASPTLVGDRLLLVSTKGVAVSVAAENTFRELGRAELGEGVHASPAIVDGRIYLRGLTNLFCLGAKAGDPGARGDRKP